MGPVWSRIVGLMSTSQLVAVFRTFQQALLRQLKNELLMGGVVVAVAGMLTNLSWKLLWWIRHEIHSRLFTTVEVPLRSASFPAFMRWLQAQPGAWDSSLLYVQRSTKEDVTADPGAEATAGTDDSTGRDRFTYIPAENASVRLTYGGRYLWVSAGGTGEGGSRQGIASSMRRLGLSGGGAKMRKRGGVGNTGAMPSSYRITLFGKDKRVITQLLREGQRLRKEEANLMTEVYATRQSRDSGRQGMRGRGRPSFSSGALQWYKVGARPCRSIKSVILPGDRAEHILSDCQEFLRSEKWYAQRGIPYRRGYLFEGKPGAGKTSLINALAGSLRLPIYMVSLSTPGMSDDTLLSLFHDTDPQCLLLMEDVDAVFAGDKGAKQRQIVQSRPTRRRPGGDGEEDEEGTDDEPQGTLTFAGLLNAIDGVVAQQGRLLFMTTNHIERLDAALIRSGRIDYIMHFQLATQDQARRLFVRFFESESDTDAHDDSLPTAAEDTGPAEALADPRREAFLKELDKLSVKFASAVPADSRSMADLQGFLMRYRKKPRSALAHVDELYISRTTGDRDVERPAAVAMRQLPGGVVHGGPPLRRSVSAPAPGEHNPGDSKAVSPTWDLVSPPRAAGAGVGAGAGAGVAAGSTSGQVARAPAPRAGAQSQRRGRSRGSSARGRGSGRGRGHGHGTGGQSSDHAHRRRSKKGTAHGTAPAAVAAESISGGVDATVDAIIGTGQDPTAPSSAE